MPTQIAHRRLPMLGRNPREPHRTATTLELLYDLTFVVGFSAAGNDAPIAACLLVLALAPAVTVVGYEFVGYRHRSEMLDRST